MPTGTKPPRLFRRRQRVEHYYGAPEDREARWTPAVVVESLELTYRWGRRQWALVLEHIGTGERHYVPLEADGEPDGGIVRKPPPPARCPACQSLLVDDGAGDYICNRCGSEWHAEVIDADEGS